MRLQYINKLVILCAVFCFMFVLHVIWEIITLPTKAMPCLTFLFFFIFLFSVFAVLILLQTGLTFRTSHAC